MRKVFIGPYYGSLPTRQTRFALAMSYICDRQCVMTRTPVRTIEHLTATRGSPIVIHNSRPAAPYDFAKFNALIGTKALASPI